MERQLPLVFVARCSGPWTVTPVVGWAYSLPLSLDRAGVGVRVWVVALWGTGSGDIPNRRGPRDM